MHYGLIKECLVHRTSLLSYCPHFRPIQVAFLEGQVQIVSSGKELLKKKIIDDHVMFLNKICHSLPCHFLKIDTNFFCVKNYTKLEKNTFVYRTACSIINFVCGRLRVSIYYIERTVYAVVWTEEFYYK